MKECFLCKKEKRLNYTSYCISCYREYMRDYMRDYRKGLRRRNKCIER